VRNRRNLFVLVLLLLFQVSVIAPAHASIGDFLNEVSGALDRVSATLNRTFGGADEDNYKVIEQSREKAPKTSAFIGGLEDKWELSMGKKTHESLKKDPGFYRNKRALNRLGTVARRLIKHVERKDLTWHFAVLDTDEVNAFAAPGGYVYVTRGLLDMVETEDELAGVVAHEMGHVDCKHSVRQAEKAGLLTLLVAGLGLNKKTRKYAPYAAIASYFANLKFSRSDEYEADECAVKYSYAAGYDPNGLIGFFHKINHDNKLSKVTKYFSTHPPTEDRIEAVEEQIAKLPRRIGNGSNNSASSSSGYSQSGSSSGSSASSNSSSNSGSVNRPTSTNTRPSSSNKPSSAELKRAYETYLYYKQLYQYKVQKQAPMNEIMEVFKKYQAAKENYIRLRKAAGY
jgi:predicted Zn-dependent protease